MKNQTGSILVVILVIVVILVGGYLILGKINNINLIDQVNQVISKKYPDNKTEILPSSIAQIQITKNGFIPTTITVAKDQQVTWINSDTANHQIISDDTGIDSETLEPGDSFTFTFEQTGIFSFYDRLKTFKPRGTIIVR